MAIEPEKPPYQAKVLDNQGHLDRVWLNFFNSWMGRVIAGVVQSIRGTAGRILVTGTATDPIINIDPAYVASAAQGGTGQSSYLLGDTLYASGTTTLFKLPGSISSFPRIMAQNGTGIVSAAPSWATRTELLKIFNILDFDAISGTDSTTAIQRAINAAAAVFGAVRIPYGDYIITGSLYMNASRVRIFGDGPRNSILYYQLNGACIVMNQDHNPSNIIEFCGIENIGFECGSDVSTSVAIDNSNAPTSIIKNVWSYNFYTGLQMLNSYNTTVEDCRFIHNRMYGINAAQSTNDTCFLNCTVTCTEAAGSRGALFESCHGISWKGGAIEDAEWGIEMQSGELTFDGYQESNKLGAFLITSNKSFLNILNLYANNIGSGVGSAVVLSNASESHVFVQQMRLDSQTQEPEWLFNLASGAASLTYGKISADKAKFLPYFGANFETHVSGLVEPFIPLSGRDTLHFGSTVTAASDTTLPNNGSKFEVLTGTGTINGFATVEWRVGESFWTFQAGGVTYKHNTAPSTGFAKLFMLGALDVAAVTNDWIQWVWDGSVFRQMTILRNMSDPTFTGTVTATGLAGTGNRLLQANAAGVHSASITIPSGGGVDTYVARGSVTLIAGVGTVADVAVTSGTIVRYWVKAPGGTQGFLSYANTAGVGFVINSSNLLDVSLIEYEVVSY